MSCWAGGEPAEAAGSAGLVTPAVEEVCEDLRSWICLSKDNTGSCDGNPERGGGGEERSGLEDL